MSVQVINEYASCAARLKDALKRYCPAVFERYVKILRVSFLDRRRGPQIRAYINAIVAQTPFPLFELIEIETINRCNGLCSFCPVNRNDDTRPFKLMDERLFHSIIEQLAGLGYTGKVGLYSNNEPLMDSRVIELAAFARKTLPGAYLFLMTNGTLLTVEKLTALMPLLDKLIIDNYSDDLKLIGPVKTVVDYYRENNLYQDKIIVWLRKQNEILTNRAGQAKNRSPSRPLRSACIYPFTQMIVRPDGKVSLCCNDALGKVTMGDLNLEKIIDVWRGPEFSRVREQLARGRDRLPMCRACDSGGL